MKINENLRIYIEKIGSDYWSEIASWTMVSNTWEICYEFNTVELNIALTSLRGEEDKMAFLYVLLEMADAILEQSEFKKKMWFVQYSLVPVMNIRHQICFLIERTRNICSDKTLTNKTAFIKQHLKENEIPDVFVEKKWTTKSTKLQIAKKSKTNVFNS